MLSLLGKLPTSCPSFPSSLLRLVVLDTPQIPKLSAKESNFLPHPDTSLLPILPFFLQQCLAIVSICCLLQVGVFSFRTAFCSEMFSRSLTLQLQHIQLFISSGSFSLTLEHARVSSD